MPRRYRTLTGLLAALLASAFVGGQAPEAANKPKAVVELFTSQGCSSCVPADAYLAELAERGDVLALSFHVDYWDYLGWRDTLGDAANSERQRQYAEARGSRRIYTPQMVVNGGKDLVGSDRAGVEAAIAQSSLKVPVTMRRGEGTVEIEVAGHAVAFTGAATIRLVLITSEADVTITRGENAGSSIEYYNVVREMRPIGMWHGETVRISLPQDEIMADGVDACAILVQEDLASGPGAIVGAAWLESW